MPGAIGFRVSILIINFRSYSELAACLNSLRPHVTESVEVIVIDHESRSDAAADILQAFSWIRLIPFDDNPGFAAGVNRAARVATGKYLLLLNPDTIVEDDVPQVLASWMEAHPRVGVCGGVVREADASVQASARSFPNAITGVAGRTSWLTRSWPNNPWSRRNLLTERSDRPLEVDWIAGSCMMISREAFDAVGGMDERFFMYWEDADICFRLRQKGWCSVYVPVASVTHLTNRSGAQTPIKSAAAFHQSAFRYFCKHAGKARVLAPLVFLALQVRLLFKLLPHVTRTMRSTVSELIDR
jgi:GT2 family glycosyltransferase